MAEEIDSVEMAPIGVTSAIGHLGTIDSIKTWPLGGPTGRNLVQATFTAGGNSYFFTHFLFNGDPAVLLTELPLNQAIKQVDLTDDILTLTTFVYQDGDGRCCPSAEGRFELLLGR